MAVPGRTLAERLGLHFDDPSLLAQALVRSSYVHEHPDARLTSNERLEFLGDTVVGLIISEALWERYPDESEGSLTTRRAAIVSTRGLSRIAVRLELGPELLIGLGAEVIGERGLGSILAGALEALVAAIYLDQGLAVARQHLLEWAAPELESSSAREPIKPPKSRLQEHAIATTGRPPDYRVLSDEGPDHAKNYVVEVSIAGERLGRGEGRNRRDAESQAARVALDTLQRTERPSVEYAPDAP